jgi:glycine cleavage system H protein
MEHLMTRHSSLIVDCLLGFLLAAAILAILPVIGALIFIVRPGIIIAATLLLIIIVALFASSRRFRAWVHEESMTDIDYRGLKLDPHTRVSLNHSWARIYDVVVVGVDDILQAALGPIEAVELPADGTRVRSGEPLFVLCHADRRIEVASPISGTVLACNSAIRKNPALINENPFHDGWVVRLQSDVPSEERKSLLCGCQARKWFREEVDRLFETLGGSRRDDAAVEAEIPPAQIHSRLDDHAWRELSSTLRAQSSHPA